MMFVTRRTEQLQCFSSAVYLNYGYFANFQTDSELKEFVGLETTGLTASSNDLSSRSVGA